MNHRRNTILLILIATLVRCTIALTTELGNDEVYYRLYADPLQWNYFDHPPMVGWLIRFFTVNLWIDTGFTIRLGAIICGAIATWFMYKCGKRLAGAYAGFLAALLYTLNIYGSIIAGTFILPDSPQMVCWVAALYLLISITESKEITKKNVANVLLFGVVTGIGMLCKIHSIFLWFGFGLFVLVYNRKWLQHWSLYAAAVISILFFLPVIIWNIQHHFVTFVYHGKRIDVATGGIDVAGMLTFIGGQILYCNPVVFFVIFAALRHRHFGIKQQQKKILLLVALPLIGLATAVSLFKTLLPHWTGPAFASLLLLTACHFSTKETRLTVKPTVPVAFKIAAALLIVVVLAGIPLINFFPGTIGSKDAAQKGSDDFTLDLYGWKKFAISFDSIYHSRHKNKDEKSLIITDKWFPAAHLDFYVGQPLGIQTVALGPIEDIHQYYWLNSQRRQLPAVTDVYIIIPSNYFSEINQYPLVKGRMPVSVDTIIQNRSGKEARKFYVYYFGKDNYTIEQQKF